MRVVHGEWQSVLADRRRARRLWLAAACLSLVMLAAVTAALWPRTALPVANVERVKGEVLVRMTERGEGRGESLVAERVSGGSGESLVAERASGGSVDPAVMERGGGRSELLTMGRVVRVGEELDSSAGGRVLLALASGAHLRLDNHSVAKWLSPTELHLARGTIYAETSASASGASPQLIVSTPFGVVRHVGTRFEVRVDGAQARVRVREGAVDFERGQARPVRVERGQQLIVDPSRATLEAGPGSADAQWAWTREIAPDFSIEGRSLVDALEWLGRESGLRVVYRDPGARAQAQAVTLRGSIDGLDMRDALLAVLAGSGLVFSLEPAVIEIGVSRDNGDVAK